jgi:hypothetical protein
VSKILSTRTKRFKIEPPKAPLGFASASAASEGKRFGTGSGFWGEVKTFGCADGRFSGGIRRQDDGWQEKEKSKANNKSLKEVPKESNRVVT